ncbi:unnamed protein product [Victoria cruziana]
MFLNRLSFDETVFFLLPPSSFLMLRRVDFFLIRICAKPFAYFPPNFCSRCDCYKSLHPCIGEDGRGGRRRIALQIPPAVGTRGRRRRHGVEKTTAEEEEYVGKDFTFEGNGYVY